MGWEAEGVRHVLAELLGRHRLRQRPDLAVTAALRAALDGVKIQGDLLVRVGRRRRGYSTVGGVGREDGLEPDLLHLLQPALLPQVRVRGLASQKRSEERRVGKECRSRWSP